MASGIASPWGMSMPMVAGLHNSLDSNGRHLTGQLSLNSIMPDFVGGNMVSPLTTQNKSFYTKFGKVKNGSLKNVIKDINYLKKQH